MSAGRRCGFRQHARARTPSRGAACDTASCAATASCRPASHEFPSSMTPPLFSRDIRKNTVMICGDGFHSQPRTCLTSPPVLNRLF
ncbi:hypothetical protein HBH56_150240 [Parastagonospora nodorum]|nr:hypothetical protein HBH56_150240 [Parastagonospora nodorum]KAH3928522.1 hypothetical protein HBH54_136140 [Parastagonospora nodorum]KAH4142434.1 hypothetical protein HBH45_054090 [Parastagonospora nodorum]KAH4156077.1 hypothetical protein HBH44_130830 [Parastagonospora nodorum]KAH4576134.1 hypothetical protein HBH84_075440 [Parastagonospora nodorum]